jgi:hypothetical protein
LLPISVARFPITLTLVPIDNDRIGSGNLILFSVFVLVALIFDLCVILNNVLLFSKSIIDVSDVCLAITSIVRLLLFIKMSLLI